MASPHHTAPSNPLPLASIDRAWPPPPPFRQRESGASWIAWTASAVASIWTAVVLISWFSPDMVSGSEQQRMPIAALTTWLWGSGATIATLVAMARLRRVGRQPDWIAMGGATIAMWSAATVVSIFAPTLVTGTDPTTVPLGALISPIAAMLATVLAGAAVLAVGAIELRRR